MENKRKNFNKESLNISPAVSTDSPKACAACRHQRRKCTLDCPLAPYFPHSCPGSFHKAHKVFGVSNITKALHNVSPYDRHRTMTTIICEANARCNNLSGGSYSILQSVRHQLQSSKQELLDLSIKLENCRAQAHTHPHALPLIPMAQVNPQAQPLSMTLDLTQAQANPLLLSTNFLHTYAHPQVLPFSMPQGLPEAQPQLVHPKTFQDFPQAQMQPQAQTHPQMVYHNMSHNIHQAQAHPQMVHNIPSHEFSQTQELLLPHSHTQMVHHNIFQDFPQAQVLPHAQAHLHMVNHNTSQNLLQDQVLPQAQDQPKMVDHIMSQNFPQAHTKELPEVQGHHQIMDHNTSQHFPQSQAQTHPQMVHHITSLDFPQTQVQPQSPAHPQMVHNITSHDFPQAQTTMVYCKENSNDILNIPTATIPCEENYENDYIDYDMIFSKEINEDFESIDHSIILCEENKNNSEEQPIISTAMISCKENNNNTENMLPDLPNTITEKSDVSLDLEDFWEQYMKDDMDECVYNEDVDMFIFNGY